MAKIKIKEGSTVIEIETETEGIIFSQAFPKLKYEDLEIELWEKGNDASTYKQGHFHRVKKHIYKTKLSSP